MHHRAIATLQEILRPHVGLGKSRLETLCLLVVGMISARTVNLSHLACERAARLVARRASRSSSGVDAGSMPAGDFVRAVAPPNHRTR